MSAASPSPLCRVVVSYARKDETHRSTFRMHVADIQRSGVEFFDDRDIPGGTDWERALFGSLDRADIVVLLMTANYVASDFCMERELPRALHRAQAGECRLFPINVAPFDLMRDSPLRKLQWIPSGKPISGYGNAASREWRRVAQELRKLIESTAGTTSSPGVSLHQPGVVADALDDKATGARNTIINSSIGTSIIIGEIRDMTIDLPRPDAAADPDGKRDFR